VLVTGAGLLFRSLGLINQADPGYMTEGITTYEFSLPAKRYPSDHSKRILMDELLGEIQSLPGVAMAAAVGTVPLLANNLNSTDAYPDALSQEDERVFVDYTRVTPGYFEAMGIQVISGRALNEEDRPEGLPVAVIDQSLARHWPDGAAVGKTIDIFGLQLSVVGVVDHARLYSLHEDDRPQLYISYAQFPEATMSVVVRSPLDLATLVPGIRGKLAGLDPDLPIFNVNTIEQLAKNSTGDRRFATVLLIAFALAGLFLAALGVYGILAYTVANRSREIGIRMALGAQGRRMEGWILGQGLVLAGVGILVGLGGAFASSRLLAGLIYQISPLDPLTYCLGSLFVLVAAGVACILPARRASSSDVLEVLRAE
jgi:putative ABC transport system permease protein